MIAGSGRFDARWASSDQKLERFGAALKGRLDSLPPTVIGEDTCIYVTGSGGRGELSDHSDLDVFLLREGARPSRLDEMVIGSAVILAMKECGFPDPSNDGEFLTLHRLDDMIARLGQRQDDAENLFTARMLLLLESRCVAGTVAYERAIDAVVDTYWRNADRPRRDYLPIILLNDISRYWRIVLLNYEAKQNLAPGQPAESKQDETSKAKRRLRSHKLRFSRCLLCYSAIALLLAETAVGSGHVEKEKVREMIPLRPIDRLVRVGSLLGDVQPIVDGILDRYAEFLERMNHTEGELVGRFQKQPFRRDCSQKGEEFGSEVFRLVEALGQGNPLYRFLVV